MFICGLGDKFLSVGMYFCCVVFGLGRVGKGVRCSVVGCDRVAVRSLGANRVLAAGLRVGSGRRVFLCKEHYREFKKVTKKDRMLERWRFKR